MQQVKSDIFWGVGILLGGSTVTLVLWQIGFIVALAVVDLNVVSLWFAFAAAVAGSMRKYGLSHTLTGIGLVPLAATFMVIMLLPETQTSTLTSNIASGMFLGAIFVHLVVWAIVADKKIDFTSQISAVAT